MRDGPTVALGAALTQIGSLEASNTHSRIFDEELRGVVQQFQDGVFECLNSNDPERASDFLLTFNLLTGKMVVRAAEAQQTGTESAVMGYHL
jgi:hypothetical protein